MTLDGPLVLHGSSTSPFVRKVRVVLIEKGIEHEFRLTPPWSPTGGVERVNPLLRVPTLELADGTYLNDSTVIENYLELRLDRRPMLPAAGPARIAALQTEALADGISEAVALHVQEGWRRPDARSAFWLDRLLTKIRSGIAALESPLQTPDIAALPGIAEIATGAALAFTTFWLPQVKWHDASPNLVALLDNLEVRDAWQQTRPYLIPNAAFPNL